ncbi:MAG TPA: serine/threonine-protein kinase, partial [Pirellulales bacterium]|nr:serine/threonine-protein kinase [Pirellulales bacterium]
AFQHYLKAFQLWEAWLKLTASVALAEYGQLPEHDPAFDERLKKLLRPSLGDWRATVKLLVPLLAKQGVAGFAGLNDFLFERTHHELPLAAGLMAALQQAKDGKHHSRATVRLDDLFLKLIETRNDIAHGAPGHEDDEIYQRLAGTMLSAVAQILAGCDVLAGRRLVAVYDVSRSRDGSWSVGWRELRGNSPAPLEPLSLAPSDGGLAPQPYRVYLSPPGDTSAAASADGAQAIARALVPMYPLVVCGDRSGSVLFYNKRLDGAWNGRGKASRTQFLNFEAGGSPTDINDPPSQQLSWAEQLLGYAPQQLHSDEPPDGQSPDGQSPAEPGPGPQFAPPAETAERWIGEFRILGRLGEGGMGTVYRAWDPSLNRIVALKVLRKSGNQEHQQRFAREVRALGQVKDPHLAEVFSASADGDQFFYAMELIDGATLDSVCELLQSQGSPAGTLDLNIWQAAVTTTCDRARQDALQTRVSDDPSGTTSTPRPPERIVDLPPGSGYVHCVAELLRQVARAAHKLHLTGAIHRDIKPGNIMVRSAGTHAILIDLGLAQLADETEGKLTRTRQIMGTLRYASPEQVLSVRKLDGRSDVYSLGATLWELLTLQPMFGATGSTPMPELMQRIQYEEPVPVRRYHRRVPRDLEAVVMKCLEKNPDSRYQTAEEL